MVKEAERIRLYTRPLPENIIVAASILRRAQETNKPCSIFFTDTLTRQMGDTKDTMLCYDLIPTAQIKEITDLDEYLTEEEHRVYRYVLSNEEALLLTVGKKRKSVSELIQTVFTPQLITIDHKIFFKQHKIETTALPLEDMPHTEKTRLLAAVPQLAGQDIIVQGYTIEEWQAYINYAVKINKPALGIAFVLYHDKRIITELDRFQKKLREYSINLLKEPPKKYGEWRIDAPELFWEPLILLLHTTDVIEEKTPLVLKTTTLEGKERVYITLNRTSLDTIKSQLEKQEVFRVKGKKYAHAEYNPEDPSIKDIKALITQLIPEEIME